MKDIVTMETKLITDEIERLNKKIEMWKRLGEVFDQYRISHKPFNINTIGEAVFGKDFREEDCLGHYTPKARRLHDCLGQVLFHLHDEGYIYKYTELSIPGHKNGAIIYYIP